MAAGTMMLVPALPLQAAPQAAQQVRTGTDLILVKGELKGKLLSANGKPVEGALVTVSKGGQEVARTATKTDGTYTVKGLTGGTHTVIMADGKFPVRLWSQDAAPAAAKSQLNVTQTAVRGQLLDCDGNPIIGNVVVAAVAVTALTLALIESNKNEDLEDDIQELQEQLDQLASP